MIGDADDQRLPARARALLAGEVAHLQELERHLAQLNVFQSKPGVDSARLRTVMSNLLRLRADLVACEFVTSMDESTPCRNNLLGVKGVGELGTIGATPTVVNAVIDALVRAGVPTARVEALQMPLTPERVWRALHG